MSKTNIITKSNVSTMNLICNDSKNNIDCSFTITLQYLFDNILKYKDRYIHTDNDGDYYIEVIGDTIFIYFEESDSWADWMSNFNFPASTYKNSEHKWKCHKGFLRVWKTMRDQVDKTVEELINYCNRLNEIDPCNNKRISQIVCAGYSHGGPLSGLCLEDMNYLYKEKYGLKVYGYAFGCPRFVWGRLPEEVSERFDNFYVIRMGKDIVTHVPPKLFLYKHGRNNDVNHINPVNKYNAIDAHRPETYKAELTNLYKITEVD